MAHCEHLEAGYAHLASGSRCGSGSAIDDLQEAVANQQAGKYKEQLEARLARELGLGGR
jgi:hypothetical protein